MGPAQCNQGNTYAGSHNQICGGSSWGETEVECGTLLNQHAIRKWMKLHDFVAPFN